MFLRQNARRLGVFDRARQVFKSAQSRTIAVRPVQNASTLDRVAESLETVLPRDRPSGPVSYYGSQNISSKTMWLKQNCDFWFERSSRIFLFFFFFVIKNIFFLTGYTLHRGDFLVIGHDYIQCYWISISEKLYILSFRYLNDSELSSSVNIHELYIWPFSILFSVGFDCRNRLEKFSGQRRFFFLSKDSKLVFFIYILRFLTIGWSNTFYKLLSWKLI